MSAREKVLAMLATTDSRFVSPTDGPIPREFGYKAILALRRIIEAHEVRRADPHGISAGCWICSCGNVVRQEKRIPWECPEGARIVAIAAQEIGVTE